MHLNQQHRNTTGIFNKKHEYFFRCFTSRRINTWNMHTGFYEIFCISDKQFFYVMKFLNAMIFFFFSEKSGG